LLPSTSSIVSSSSTTSSASNNVTSNPPPADDTTPVKFHAIANQPKTTPNITEKDWLALVKHVHDIDHGAARLVKDRIGLMGITHPDLDIYINQVMKKCGQCLQFNPMKRVFNPARSVHARRPWYHIQLDLIGPLPESKGCRYLLIAVDVFSSYVYLTALESKAASAVSEALVVLFAERGAPKIIQTDNGSEFKNDLVQSILKTATVELRLNAAYHQQSNGKVERHVGIFKSILYKLLNQTGSDITRWGEFTKAIQLHINTRPNRFYGLSPFYIINTYNTDECLGRDFPIYNLKLSLPEWYSKQNAIATIQDEIASILEAQESKSRARIDQRHKVSYDPLPIGSKVLVANHAATDPHAPLFIGPFSIINITEFGTYQLQDLSKLNPERRIAPREDLKVLSTDPNELVYGEFAMEAIHNVRNIGTKNEMYLIKWLGYNYCTWEPKHNIDFETRTTYLQARTKAHYKKTTPNPIYLSLLNRSIAPQYSPLFTPFHYFVFSCVFHYLFPFWCSLIQITSSFTSLTSQITIRTPSFSPRSLSLPSSTL
jgi:transposase InsO family protein